MGTRNKCFLLRNKKKVYADTPLMNMNITRDKMGSHIIFFLYLHLDDENTCCGTQKHFSKALKLNTVKSGNIAQSLKCASGIHRLFSIFSYRHVHLFLLNIVKLRIHVPSIQFCGLFNI